MSDQRPEDAAAPKSQDETPDPSGGAWWRWGTPAMIHAIISTVAVIGFLALGLAWFNNDEISDRFVTVGSMQDRLAISVASPTVHTRERLLNDRFEQIAWLDDELALTNPSKDPEPTPKQISAVTPGQEKDQSTEAANPKGFFATDQRKSQTSYHLDDARYNFELSNGVRDLIRAERAREMLDDRHDIDNNTLDLFSFDTTIMPRDGTHRGFAAIEVVLTREPTDLKANLGDKTGAIRRYEEQKQTDLFDTYVTWLERIRELQKQNLKTLTLLLNTQELVTSRSDYEVILRTNACTEFLKKKTQPPEKSSARREDCLNASIGATPRDYDDSERHIPGSDQAILAMKTISEKTRILADFIMRYNPNKAVEGFKSLYAISAKQPMYDDMFADAETIVSNCRGNWYDPGYQVSMFRVPDPRNSLFKESLFPCSAIVKNASLRALFEITQTLLDKQSQSTNDFSDSDQSDNQIDNGKLNILPGIDISVEDTIATPVNCLAATLLEESLVRPDAQQPRNHGAELAQFFNIRIDHLSTGCFISVQPKILTLRLQPMKGVSGEGISDEEAAMRNEESTQILKALGVLLEGPGYGGPPDDPNTRAYGYSLSPRLQQHVEIAALRATQAGVGVDDRLNVDLGRRQGLNYRGLEPEVVGFTRPIATAEQRRMQGARFGWLWSPRPDSDGSWSLPMEQAQLGAAVALPSWWRSALLQICTRFVPQRAIAQIMTDEFWRDAENCRVEMIRLPGSAVDISRRLGMDVLTTPYVETWDKQPVLFAGDTGEPTHLIIKGERLWRNTVVTLGAQKADRIEVLPDMFGITATFNCVLKPPGTLLTAPVEDPLSTPAGIEVPVIVWTSEGHTLDQPATIVVPADHPAGPCPTPGRKAPRDTLVPLQAKPIKGAIQSSIPATTTYMDTTPEQPPPHP